MMAGCACLLAINSCVSLNFSLGTSHALMHMIVLWVDDDVRPAVQGQGASVDGRENEGARSMHAMPCRTIERTGRTGHLFGYVTSTRGVLVRRIYGTACAYSPYCIVRISMQRTASAMVYIYGQTDSHTHGMGVGWDSKNPQPALTIYILIRDRPDQLKNAWPILS